MRQGRFHRTGRVTVWLLIATLGGTIAAQAPAQGGEDCTTATVIPALPFNDNGTTSGFGNDYDEVCPFTGSTSPDVVYSFAPAASTSIDIDLCASGYDTKVYVYENTCVGGSLIACNDDACGIDGFRSQLLNVPLTGGNTYYIVVDGFGGDSGPYEMAVDLVRGACCLPAVGCERLTEADCAAQGGMYQGDGIGCDPEPCTDGACCFPDDSCDEITELECGQTGGVFFAGPGTSCADLDCAPGACCTIEGKGGIGCELFPPDVCDLIGGVFIGGDCLPDICTASGSCCIDTLCLPIGPLECAAQGGVFMPSGTPCMGDPCVPAVAACCLPTGDCMLLTPAQCQAAGGLFVGGFCADAQCVEPGWYWVDNKITLTSNEPTYWSVATGQPKGVSPFTVLDPGAPPGRPAMDGTTDRVLRGYVVAWAVTSTGEEIRWNHLKGEGTIVNYRDSLAWEYNAFAHQVVDPAVAHGGQTGTPGELFLDGNEYAMSYAELLLNFQAANSAAFTSPPAQAAVISDTDLTLHPVAADLRQNSDGPVTTKASMLIWNENEHKFSGTHRCVTCWDQTLLSRYDAPNHFLRMFLQTDHGKARIEGEAADVCDVPDDPMTPEDESVTSIDAPLLGVAARHLAINAAPPAFTAAAGSNLVGMGLDDTAVVRYDVHGAGGPPEGQDPGAGARLAPTMRARTGGEVPGAPEALMGAGQDRVTASEKGSLLFFTKVEIRWSGDAGFPLVQDTFISITNDYPQDVQVQMYFVNGDPPVPGP
jgi:hypothetical protein